MAEEYTSILFEVQDGMARISLNHPPLNIIDIPMMAEMRAAISRVGSTSSAKVLTIDHHGKAFSAGVSIQDHTRDKVEKMLEEFHGMFRLLRLLDAPVIALVDGMALGGGCELAISCDMVLASDRATFGQPEVKVGVFPPVAAVLFPHLIGRNRTLELLLSGETVGAEEAKEMGLINKIFPAGSFRGKCAEFIGKLTSLSGPVLKLTKRAVNRGLQDAFGDTLTSVEQIYLRELMQTEDAREGLNSFLEKRKPVWKEK